MVSEASRSARAHWCDASWVLIALGTAALEAPTSIAGRQTSTHSTCGAMKRSFGRVVLAVWYLSCEWHSGGRGDIGSPAASHDTSEILTFG